MLHVELNVVRITDHMCMYTQYYYYSHPVCGYMHPFNILLTDALKRIKLSHQHTTSWKCMLNWIIHSIRKITTIFLLFSISGL